MTINLSIVEGAFLAALQPANDLRNTRQLTIDILALIVADYTAAGAFADVDLVDGVADSDHLPFGDELFDHHTLDAGINVGRSRIGAYFAGHIDPPGIGASDNECEKCDEKKQT